MARQCEEDGDEEGKNKIAAKLEKIMYQSESGIFKGPFNAFLSLTTSDNYPLPQQIRTNTPPPLLPAKGRRALSSLSTTPPTPPYSHPHPHHHPHHHQQHASRSSLTSSPPPRNISLTPPLKSRPFSAYAAASMARHDRK